jgi:hypothetical protein
VRCLFPVLRYYTFRFLSVGLYEGQGLCYQGYSSLRSEDTDQGCHDNKHGSHAGL